MHVHIHGVWTKTAIAEFMAGCEATADSASKPLFILSGQWQEAPEEMFGLFDRHLIRVRVQVDLGSPHVLALDVAYSFDEMGCTPILDCFLEPGDCTKAFSTLAKLATRLSGSLFSLSHSRNVAVPRPTMCRFLQLVYDSNLFAPSSWMELDTVISIIRSPCSWFVFLNYLADKFRDETIRFDYLHSESVTLRILLPYRRVPLCDRFSKDLGPAACVPLAWLALRVLDEATEASFNEQFNRLMASRYDILTQVGDLVRCRAPS